MFSISVAMTTYNGERFLDEQLESIRAQVYAPSELIVCDDGSSDNTFAILENFSRSAPFPVRLFKNVKQLGYRKNFMNAAGHADGDLIAFCDQDDIWEADKLLRSSKEFADKDTIMSYHCVDLIDAEGIMIRNHNDQAPPVNPLTPADFCPWLFGLGFTLMFRAKLNAFTHLWASSSDFLYDDGRPLAHDQWFFFLASTFGNITYIKEPLAKYRQHDRNLFGAGGTNPNSLSYSYRQRLSERYGRYLNYARHCRRNSEILVDAEKILDAKNLKRAKIGSNRYKELSVYPKLSADIIGNPHFIRKIAALRRLWSLGYYDNRAAVAFERRRFAKDVLACLASNAFRFSREPAGKD